MPSLDDDKYLRENRWDSDEDYELTKAEVVLQPEGSLRSSIESQGDDFFVTGVSKKDKARIFPKSRKNEAERRPILQNGDSHWVHTVDNEFAQTFLDRLIGFDDLPKSTYSSALCKRCTNVSLGNSISLRSLRRKLSPCLICRLSPRLSQAVDERNRFLSAPSLRICASPKTKNAHPDIQVGFPVLLAPDSPIRFDLFREWLRVCDQGHAACNHRGSTVDLPTRVVDVGNVGDEGADILHLSTFSPEDRENYRTDYIALSHCWGNLTEEETRAFCTSRENIEERFEKGFPLSVLPQSFRDAVILTRKLGKRYLWIDALCIIQHGDDLEDWKKEARKMEAVYRNAYCTIAATSAKDPTRGFLGRAPAQDPELQFIKVNSASHGRIYVSATADNFREDVENGILNQRAWTMQERALARRTIHFTANQAYFECGDGVRCETLTHMRNSKEPFFSDPYFPESLALRTSQDKIKLFQSLFETYSQLGMKRPTDRPLAISGLEQRLATTFRTKCSYGVFERYLHRSLLWQRCDPTKLKKLEFSADMSVPSWSWMAHEGKIKYLDINSDDVEWSEDLQLTGNALQAQVRRFKNCTMGRDDEGNYLIMDRKGKLTPGWLRYDGKRRPTTRKHKCVVIGRQESRPLVRLNHSTTDVRYDYYVLVVTSTHSADRRAYKRIGVGCVPTGCISFHEGGVEETII